MAKRKGKTAVVAAGPVRTKGERTRARLLDAARRVFEERGYLDTRIADIAQEANISVGSFYTYFNGKEPLFLTLVEAFYMDLNPVSLDSDVEEDAIVRIDTTNRAYIDFYRRNVGMLTLIELTSDFLPQVRELRLAKRRLNVALNMKAIVRLQERGLISADLDPFITANALLSMVGAFTYSWFVLGEDYEPEAAARHMTTLWARALGLDHHVSAGAAELVGAVPARKK